ncbi:MAG: hypothetical protein IPP94_15555 [Ignavibacteria bacterium]|nr:hypothetical protein [Ignavibacteria bacterium]
MRKVPSFLILLAFVLAPALRAQDVKVSATLDSASYAIGDWMRAVLTVDAPQGLRVVLPVDSADVVHAEIVDSEPLEKVTEGGRDRITRTYVLTAFDTGRVAISLKVRYRKQGDTTLYTAETAPVLVSIRAIEVDTSHAYKDIKDVVDVPLTIWEILAYIGIALAVLAIGWYAYRRYMRVPVEVPPEEVQEVVRPPYDIAMEKLTALEARRLWEQGFDKEFQSELTEIVREYIELRYRVPALEQVTSEIVSGVAMMGLQSEIILKLEQMLRVADMTKFATYTPAPSEHALGLRIAHEFLEQTKPPAMAAPGTEEQPHA